MPSSKRVPYFSSNGQRDSSPTVTTVHFAGYHAPTSATTRWVCAFVFFSYFRPIWDGTPARWRYLWLSPSGFLWRITSSGSNRNWSFCRRLWFVLRSVQRDANAEFCEILNKNTQFREVATPKNKGLIPLYRPPQRISPSLDLVNTKERLLRGLWPAHPPIEKRTLFVAPAIKKGIKKNKKTQKRSLE